MFSSARGPGDYSRNDGDMNGMHAMFEEYGMTFDRRCVVDERTEPEHARRLIRQASCVFLMGGHPGLQMKLMREMKLEDELRQTNAAVLGVSAGSINMAVHSLDTKESPIPYDGLRLADITLKPHFSIENKAVLSELLRISGSLPICAAQDDSAIFVSDGVITLYGALHYINKGHISPLTPENLASAVV